MKKRALVLLITIYSFAIATANAGIIRLAAKGTAKTAVVTAKVATKTAKTVWTILF
jgi:hypothetical protein